ncbi:MAG: hypothetical protein QM765_07430 [Myxococcales bacterium]
MKAGLVDELQVRSAAARQAQWGGRLGKHVAEMGFARDETVASALAAALGLQRIELDKFPRDPAALAKVGLETAEGKGVFPYAFRDNGKSLWLAMADPTDLGTVDEIAARSGCRVRIAVAGEKEIAAAIWRHYKNQEPPAETPRGGASFVRKGGLDLESEDEGEDDASSSPATPLSGYTPPHGTPIYTTGSGGDAEEIARLKRELEKTTTVLRALIDTVVAKGVVTPTELRAAISKLSSK